MGLPLAVLLSCNGRFDSVRLIDSEALRFDTGVYTSPSASGVELRSSHCDNSS